MVREGSAQDSRDVDTPRRIETLPNLIRGIVGADPRIAAGRTKDRPRIRVLREQRQDRTPGRDVLRQLAREEQSVTGRGDEQEQMTDRKGPETDLVVGLSAFADDGPEPEGVTKPLVGAEAISIKVDPNTTRGLGPPPQEPGEAPKEDLGGTILVEIPDVRDD